MKLPRRKFLNLATVVLVAAALVAVPAIDAWSQSARPIRVVLPFAPGGPADAMARLLAEQIGSAGGPTMVVESRPGAGTEIATEYVSRADPDGNTLLIISPSFVVLPHLRKLNYDPLMDFAPICELAEFPPLIVVNSQSPYHTLSDLIDAAHERPGVLTLGTLGPATSSQMGFEMLKRVANVDITFVPFTGYTPAIQALLSNQITSALADLTTLQGQLQTGKLRALATTARRRARTAARCADRRRVRLQGFCGRVLWWCCCAGQNARKGDIPTDRLVHRRNAVPADREEIRGAGSLCWRGMRGQLRRHSA